jgi:flagellar M-ring protein FliF
MSKKPSDAVMGLLNQLSLQQKVMIGGSAVLTTVLLIVLLTFLNQPNYSPLYSDMNSDDASKVIEYLTAQKIPYKIEDNGKTIQVPKDKLYETRLNLAGKGIPASGTIGYELFDKNQMGMSEFMQKLNYKRSLEGELARTILGINGIDGVRVHIVFPERTIFRDEQKQPTASVVLKFKDSFTLPRSSSMAIVNLVASAVEGLTTNSITLIDTKGKMLWKEDDENSVSFSSNKQYEIKNSVESYLIQKAQTMLDNILGYGNSMVQVNADLNFDQVEKTMESYDPDQQVVVSEQSMVSNNAGKSISDTSAQNNQSNTTNYEIGKTVERVVQGSGNITRLSIAAVINDIPKEVQKGNVTQTVFEPRSPEQMKKLEELIKNAVGVDPNRNDQISIVNLPFQTTPASEIVEQSSPWFKDADGISNLLLVIIAIIGAIFLLRGLMSKLKNEQIFIGNVNPELALQPAMSGSKAKNLKVPQVLTDMRKKKDLLPVGDIEDEISDEAINKKNRQEKISNYVSKNPTEAAKLINAWLHEDE